MGLFNHGSSNHTCPAEPSLGTDQEPVFGHTTFHHLSIILAGGFAVFAIVVSGILVLWHGLYLTNPKEQIKIIRIISVIPIFSVLAFLCVVSLSAAQYITPWMETYESFCLASLFMLYCTYIAPDRQQLYAYFDGRQGTLGKFPTGSKGGSLPWLNKRRFLVFQYPIVAVGLAIATDITQAIGKYCRQSNKPYFAHLWLQIIEMISVALAVTSVFSFYGRVKAVLRPHRAMPKLICFKLIVFINFIQTTVFTFLVVKDHVNPTKKLSYGDLAYGLPNLLLCIEMALISILFHWAYSTTPYRKGSAGYASSTGVARCLGAIFSALNPRDLLGEILHGLQGGMSARGGGSTDQWQYGAYGDVRLQARSPAGPVETQPLHTGGYAPVGYRNDY